MSDEDRQVLSGLAYGAERVIANYRSKVTKELGGDSEFLAHSVAQLDRYLNEVVRPLFEKEPINWRSDD